MAARTDESAMPRRRNCFSTISARCGAYSMLSGMRDRRGVPFPSPGLQHFFHLFQCEVAFVLAIVKMRREAHAGFGTVIHEEFAANFVGVRTIDGDGSGALRRILGRVDLPAAGLRTLDETRSHANRFSANRLDSHLVENLEARAAGEKRWDVRRAVQIAVRILARINGAGFKRKRAAMRDPAGK